MASQEKYNYPMWQIWPASQRLIPVFYIFQWLSWHLHWVVNALPCIQHQPVFSTSRFTAIGSFFLSCAVFFHNCWLSNQWKQPKNVFVSFWIWRFIAAVAVSGNILQSQKRLVYLSCSIRWSFLYNTSLSPCHRQDFQVFENMTSSHSPAWHLAK